MKRLKTTALLIAVMAVHRGMADENGYARWEDAMRAFEKQDATARPPAGGVLFVGSSSIRLWDLQKSFPKLRTINRGFGGSQVADSLHFADRIIIPYRPRLIFLYAGDNDIAAGKSPERVASDFRRLAAKIHDELPDADLAFISIKPSIKRWKLATKMREANELVREYTGRHDWAHYVDIYSRMLGETAGPRPELFVDDGLHLNGRGYELWTAEIRELLAQLESKPTSAR